MHMPGRRFLLLLSLCLAAACNNSGDQARQASPQPTPKSQLELHVEGLSEDIARLANSVTELEERNKEIQSSLEKVLSDRERFEKNVEELTAKLANISERSPSEGGSSSGDASQLDPPLALKRAWLSFDAADVPEARVIVENTSKRTISGYDLTLYCFDRYGRPVQGTTAAGNKFPAVAQATIEPGQSHGDQNFWTLYGFESTRKIRAELETVRFSDGSRWQRDPSVKASIEGNPLGPAR